MRSAVTKCWHLLFHALSCHFLLSPDILYSAVTVVTCYFLLSAVTPCCHLLFSTISCHSWLSPATACHSPFARHLQLPTYTITCCDLLKHATFVDRFIKMTSPRVNLVLFCGTFVLYTASLLLVLPADSWSSQVQTILVQVRICRYIDLFLLPKLIILISNSSFKT